MASPESKDQYENLAAHYDAVYSAGLEDRQEEVEVLKSVSEKIKPSAESLLDLGTGTGLVLAALQDRVKEIVGVDISPSMLAQARQAVPEAELIQADMSEYRSHRQFDIVTCMFNAINHLQQFKRWESLFANVREQLKPGGIFIFDTVTPTLMNRLASYQTYDRWKFDKGRYALGVHRTGENHYLSAYTVKLERNGRPPEVLAGEMYHAAFPLEQVQAAAGKHLVKLFEIDLVQPYTQDGALKPVDEYALRPLMVYGKHINN